MPWAASNRNHCFSRDKTLEECGSRDQHRRCHGFPWPFSRGYEMTVAHLGNGSAFMAGFGGGGIGGAKSKCCPGNCLGAFTCAAPSPGMPFLSLRAGYLYSCRFSGSHRIPRESPSGPLWTTVFHDLKDLSLISVSPSRL